jgi:hypothetical protein
VAWRRLPQDCSFGYWAKWGAPVKEPSPESPFAEFAAPKESAYEAYKKRLRQERGQRWRRWGFLLLAVLSSALGASIAVSIGVTSDVFPTALYLGVIGGIVAMLLGMVGGAMAWATQVFGTDTSNPFRGMSDPWPATFSYDRNVLLSSMSIWTALQALLVIPIGTVSGVGIAVSRMAAVGAGSFFLWWASAGALAGVLFPVAGWFVNRYWRRAGARHPGPESGTGQVGGDIAPGNTRNP